MKKVLGLILTLSIMLLAPSWVLADGEVKTGLKEVIAEEISNFGDSSTYDSEITTLKNTDISSYSESDDKVNVYVFRGSTCSHCLEAIAYFTSIVPQYGKYFNLVTYEVWNNSANANLMKKVGSALGDSPDGVPYIVIGNKSFSGYSANSDSQIVAQIMATYNSTDRYDVMDNLDSTSAKNNNDSKATVVIMVAMIVIAGGILIYFVSK
jgi:glutaredoxin